MYIRAFVTADARRDSLSRAKDGTLTITVRAPAAQNQANKRVRELIAKEWGTEIENVVILAGHRARTKMISISN